MNKFSSTPLLPITPRRYALTTSGPVNLLLGLCAIVFLASTVKHAFNAYPTPKQSAIGATQRVGADELCPNDYAVKNWEGKSIKVCDSTICAGRDTLRTLATPPAPHVYRWTQSAEADYITSYHNQSIDGWMVLSHMSWVKALTKYQHATGLYGSIGEIGVHHGKFFMVLAGNALTTEPCIAMDLFADQKSNVDGSGSGSMDILLSHTERLGLPRNTLDIWPGNSMHLTAGSIAARGHSQWRILSVDGGHSFETTLHDLMLASCSVMEGGIVVLDDVTNPEWLGVMEAMSHFAHAQQHLVPFMIGYNKMYFTTSSHAKRYYDLVSSTPVFGCVPLHESRRTLGGYTICFAR